MGRGKGFAPPISGFPVEPSIGPRINCYFFDFPGLDLAGDCFSSDFSDLELASDCLVFAAFRAAWAYLKASLELRAKTALLRRLLTIS